MWTADKDVDMKAIFLCSSKNMASKKNQTFTEFEPMTCAIPVHCFTNWANKPTGSWSQRLWSVGLTVFLILKWSTVDIITIMVLLFHLLFFAFNRILCSCHSNIKIYIFFPSCNILNLLAEWAFPNISLVDRSDIRSCMCAINNCS